MWLHCVEGDARTNEIIAAMVDLTLKLWQVLTFEPWFEQNQAMALLI
jgi:hypothetical protein